MTTTTTGLRDITLVCDFGLMCYRRLSSVGRFQTIYGFAQLLPYCFGLSFITVTGAGPEEAPQSVLPAARYHVDVQVSNALADAVIHSDERTFRSQSLLHRHAEQAHAGEEVLDVRWRQVRQRGIVMARNQEAVSRKQGPVVQKSDRVLVIENDGRRVLSRRDPAEQTIRRHFLIVVTAAPTPVCWPFRNATCGCQGGGELAACQARLAPGPDSAAAGRVNLN